MLARTFARTFARRSIQAGRRKRRKELKETSVTPDVQSRSHPRVSSLPRDQFRPPLSANERMRAKEIKKDYTGERKRQKERRQWICIKVGAHGFFFAHRAFPRCHVFPAGDHAAVARFPLARPSSAASRVYVTTEETGPKVSGPALSPFLLPLSCDGSAISFWNLDYVDVHASKVNLLRPEIAGANRLHQEFFIIVPTTCKEEFGFRYIGLSQHCVSRVFTASFDSNSMWYLLCTWMCFDLLWIVI